MKTMFEYFDNGSVWFNYGSDGDQLEIYSFYDFENDLLGEVWTQVNEESGEVEVYSEFEECIDLGVFDVETELELLERCANIINAETTV